MLRRGITLSRAYLAGLVFFLLLFLLTIFFAQTPILRPFVVVFPLMFYFALGVIVSSQAKRAIFIPALIWTIVLTILLNLAALIASLLMIPSVAKMSDLNPGLSVELIMNFRNEEFNRQIVNWFSQLPYLGLGIAVNSILALLGALFHSNIVPRIKKTKSGDKHEGTQVYFDQRKGDNIN